MYECLSPTKVNKDAYRSMCKQNVENGRVEFQFDRHENTSFDAKNIFQKNTKYYIITNIISC